MLGLVRAQAQAAPETVEKEHAQRAASRARGRRFSLQGPSTARSWPRHTRRRTCHLGMTETLDAAKAAAQHRIRL
jgi:hypothetical protein